MEEERSRLGGGGGGRETEGVELRGGGGRRSRGQLRSILLRDCWITLSTSACIPGRGCHRSNHDIVMVLPTLPKSYLGKNGIYLFLDKALRYASYSSKIFEKCQANFLLFKISYFAQLKDRVRQY